MDPILRTPKRDICSKLGISHVKNQKKKNQKNNRGIILLPFAVSSEIRVHHDIIF